MPILIFIAAVLAGCLAGFTIVPHAQRDLRLTKTYIIIAILLVFNAALVNFANIQNAAVLNPLVFVLNWGKILNFLFIGYFLARISRVLKSKDPSIASYPLNKIIRSCIRAISIINGFGFIIETGYKLKNLDDLVDQFRHYGYDRWFLYFIIITETLGGIGILLHIKLRTGPAAALGLMLIMLGVVYSNSHVQDPFVYSFPAVDAFLSLALLLMLYRLERKVQRRSLPVSNYAV